MRCQFCSVSISPGERKRDTDICAALREQRWAELADMAEFLSLMGQLLDVLARQTVNLYLSFI